MMLMPYAEQGRLSEIEPLAEDTVRRRRSIAVYRVLLSWLKVQLGCFADATFLLEHLAADEFANLLGSAEGFVSMTILAPVCAALNRPDCAAVLHDRLLPYARLNATLNPFAGFGSAERYVGIFASVLGRLDEAIEHFEKSFHLDRSNGVRPWAIYSGLELASGLARRGTAEDRARALDILPQLEADASRLKMQGALSKLSETRKLYFGERVGGTQSRETISALIVEPVTPNAKDGSKEIEVPAVSQRTARLGRTPDKRSERYPANGELAAMFCRNGEYWQVGYEGYTSSLKHRRGLELISFLLRHPGRDFLPLELTHEGETLLRVPGSEARQIADGVGTPILDAEAKRSYRERLKEIREELEKLREANDLERAARLEEEQDFLTRELARAL
jgi:tetratricopeptide (TPR) repeat protein